MSLTGPGVLCVTVAVAAVAFAALLAAWPRLAARRPGALLARAGCLLGVQGLVVLALLVAANDEFDFYSGFGDLLGQQAVLRTSTSGAAPGATAPRSAPTTTTARVVHDPGAAVPGTGGRVERVVLPGPVSGTSADALVLLPAGYHDAASAARTYPVVEAFHGYPGTPQQWLGAMDLQASLDAATAAHEIAPSIVVVPDLAVPAGRDTECVDGPAGQPQLETWLTRDVPADVAADYRTAPGAGSWATAGFSMGGWCAAMATMLHPDRYAAALVFGGYFRYDPGSWVPYARTSAQAHRDDLVALAAAAPPAVSVWAETARTDPSSFPSTSALAAAARPPLSVTLAVQATGGHRTSLWAQQLPAALAWLGRSVPAFRPAG